MRAYLSARVTSGGRGKNRPLNVVLNYVCPNDFERDSVPLEVVPYIHSLCKVDGMYGGDIDGTTLNGLCTPTDQLPTCPAVEFTLLLALSFMSSPYILDSTFDAFLQGVYISINPPTGNRRWAYEWSNSASTKDSTASIDKHPLRWCYAAPTDKTSSHHYI